MRVSRYLLNGIPCEDIMTPQGWVTWWRIEDGYRHPKAQVASRKNAFNDPAACIRNGKYAAMILTTSGYQDAGFCQIVKGLQPGSTARFSAYALGCTSDPDENSHHTCSNPSNQVFQIGIEPNGMCDPFSPTVVWSPEYKAINEYALIGPFTTRVGGTGSVCVFLRSRTNVASEELSAYWDDISLVVTSSGASPAKTPIVPTVQPSWPVTYELSLSPSQYGSDWTGVAGYVQDREGSPLVGYPVHIWGTDTDVVVTSGSDAQINNTYHHDAAWEYQFGTNPTPMQVRVQLQDPHLEDHPPISDEVLVILPGHSSAALGHIVFIAKGHGGPSQNTPTPGPPSTPVTPQPTATPRSTATPRPDGTIVHTVGAGDTLFGIALLYGIDADQLRELNPSTIGPNDQIQPGMQLVVSLTGPTPMPTSSTASPTLEPTPMPTVMIEAEWPEAMELDRSDSIRVSLVRTNEQPFVATVEITGHAAITVTPVPCGTPGTPLERAFPGYAASALAQLDAASFECKPHAMEYQSLDQPRVDWEWNCVPEKPGDQRINVHVFVRWEPIDAPGDLIERQVWRDRFDISVRQPWMKTDQLSVLSLFGGFVGSACSIPWLYERIREAIKARREREEDKPKIYIARR